MWGGRPRPGAGGGAQAVLTRAGTLADRGNIFCFKKKKIKLLNRSRNWVGWLVGWFGWLVGLSDTAHCEHKALTIFFVFIFGGRVWVEQKA